ncbi:putative zinc-binding metallopeptidase [Flavobacteriaceae bacterium SZ-1-7]|uniref:zinc-binding metallopeptidase family protein n=1 Tax=Tamlana sedimenti TaxID=3134126 RepID=UPI0031248F4D
MKIFKCPNCASTIFFENSRCVNCGNVLGYDAVSDGFIIPNSYNSYYNNNFKFCDNHKYGICNWLIEDDGNHIFCKACELNRKVPAESDTENFQKWKKLEVAKHRLVYQLLKLNLPLESKIKNNQGIAFDFLSENNSDNMVTGHAGGVITILLSEADSVHREQIRMQMDEPYRTLLGHFRHEMGHYYWGFFFDYSDNIFNFRNLFGDERQDYNQAINHYYCYGAPLNWNLNFISKYATSHPWEDWAETWAHYLHIMDTLETGNAIGISFSSNQTQNQEIHITRCSNPYQTRDFKTIFETSIALTSAVNSLNRSMGLPDIYPFVVPEPVFQKLSFIHNLFNQHLYS